jgi:NAD(P)-dependent dehydrogenase (short-subunit alcohol dehydrogenase family)
MGGEAVTDPLFDVAGRVVVVTGGLGQLGATYAAALAERGAQVAILDVSEANDGLEGDTTAIWRVDVSDRAAVEAAAADIQARWGAPHALINNAAIDSPPDADPAEVGPFEDYPDASFDRIMDVNVKGTVIPCQIFGAAMAREGRGSIVNVSSVYGLLSPQHDVYEFRRRAGEQFYKPVAYSVSKSAVLNLTRYLATYWARSGVRVNTLTLAGVFDDQPKEFLDAYEPRVPLGRMLQAGEAVGAVVFLVSDASSYVTGANVVVDGGWSAW